MKDQTRTRHVFTDLSEAERRRMRELREKIDREEKDEIVAWGRQMIARHDHLREVFKQLQAERQAQGMSLGELSKRSGIDKGNLSRLENAEHPNVTLATIERYAEALGKEVRITIVDPQAA